MGKLYTSSNLQSFGMQRVTGNEPIEDRSIVETKADLMLKSTWGAFNGVAWSLPIYKGMQVLVACDSTSENNGIYWFKKSFAVSDPDNIRAQIMDSSASFDTSEMTFDDYWEKVGGGGSQVEVDNESIKFDPTQDSSSSAPSAVHGDDNQIWVNQVSGGTWS